MGSGVRAITRWCCSLSGTARVTTAAPPNNRRHTTLATTLYHRHTTRTPRTDVAFRAAKRCPPRHLSPALAPPRRRRLLTAAPGPVLAGTKYQHSGGHELPRQPLRPLEYNLPTKRLLQCCSRVVLVHHQQRVRSLHVSYGRTSLPVVFL